MNAGGEIKLDRTSLVNLEAEQGLLGVLLTLNETLDELDVTIEPQHFAEPVHARIFEVIVSMVRAGHRADAVTMINHFRADATLEQIGGTKYFARLVASAPPRISAPHYAQAVHDLYLRRFAVDRAQDAILELTALPVDERPADYLSGLAHEFSELAAAHGTAGNTTYSLGQALVASIDSAAAAYQNDGQLPGAIKTGIAVLDQRIGGMVRGDMIVVGARPSMGKTALGLQLAWNAAKTDNPALLISPEMRARQLGDRLISMALRPKRALSFARYAWGRMSEQEFHDAVEVTREIQARPLIIEDRSDITLAGIDSVVARAKVRYPKLAVCAVDYLGLVQPSNRYQGRKVDEIGEISTGLKRIAKRRDVCMVVLHQLSRALESRDNKRPTMADLRDSGAIEQDADIVIFPFREAYYLARELDACDPGGNAAIDIQERLRKVSDVMEIIIAKNRQGSTATVKAWCDITCNYIADHEPGRMTADQEAFV